MDRQVSAWITHQMAEYLAVVSSSADEDSALESGVERAAEALEAEIGAVIQDERIIASVGFPVGEVPRQALLEAMDAGFLTVDDGSPWPAIVSPLDDVDGSALLVARSGDEFVADEINLLRSMGRVLSLTRRMLQTLDHERALGASLKERQQLLERLARIQRSISHRAPLQEVLDAITVGCQELLGDDVVGLRLIDPDDPTFLLLVSSSGVSDAILDDILRSPIGVGAGGRAAVEGELVIIERYADAPDAIPSFVMDQLQSAMAAPVHEDGKIVGSLVVASYTPGRRYSDSEQEMLMALAEHASLALTDARTVEAMREAERAKDLFLAMVSHELKTPLTVIMGTLQTFRAHLMALPEDLREDMLNSAVKRGNDLQNLIDMLLKGARAELAGVRKAIFLRSFLTEAVAGFQNARPLTIGEIPDEVLFVDATAAHQVIGVLMENAVSHSRRGTIVSVECRVDARRVSVVVTNEGSLPEGTETDKLFRPFQRGDDAHSSGVGLGLYIADRLARSLDGGIDVESSDNTVSFTFWFPLERASAPEVVAIEPVKNE